MRGYTDLPPRTLLKYLDSHNRGAVVPLNQRELLRFSQIILENVLDALDNKETEVNELRKPVSCADYGRCNCIKDCQTGYQSPK